MADLVNSFFSRQVSTYVRTFVRTYVRLPYTPRKSSLVHEILNLKEAQRLRILAERLRLLRLLRLLGVRRSNEFSQFG